LVAPAALAQAAEAPAKPAAHKHAKHHVVATKAEDGTMRCEVLANGKWKKAECAPAAGKAASNGTSAPLPPPPAAAEPPAPPAPPAPPPVPVIPASLLQPVNLSEFTIGTQWVGGHNVGQYGRYNGNTYGGFDITLGFDVLHRAAPDAEKPTYFSVSGANLDFQTGSHLSQSFRDNAYSSNTSNKLGPNAEINLAFGEQGKWGVAASYNAISYTGNIISSLWTMNGNVGTVNTGLLAMGGASNSPLTKGTVTAYTVATLAPNFKQFETGTRRDQVDVSGKYELDEWTFTSHVQHEHKQGSLEESIRQTYGGMAFQLPVDFDTDRFDVSASYVDPDYQALIQYSYSKFTDNNVGAILPYVVSASALSATSGPYAMQSLYSTPPSNSAHYLTVMFNDKLAPHTRFTFNGRVGLELQDSTFPANNADPNLSSTLGGPTYTWFANLNSLNQGTGNATSLDGKAWVYQTNVSFSTELATHLDARIAYNLDARDVSTDVYKVYFGGASHESTASSIAYSVPQNWVKQTGTAELNYLIVPESSTKISATFAFNNTNRTNAQVEHSETNTIGLNVSSMIGKDILARVSWEHANRAGSLHYGTAWGNLEAGAPEEDGTPSGAYYQAPMVSDAVSIRADYAAEGDLTGGLFIKYSENRFHYPAVDAAATPTNSGDWSLTGFGQGIKNSTTLSMGPDINYRLSEALQLHLYYTYERIYYDNTGNGACAELTTGTCLGTAGYFQNKYTSDMHTAGFSADYKLTDKLKLSSEYNISVGSVLFGQFNGVAVSTVTQSYQNVTNYPDISSTMHDLRISAIYELTDSVEAGLLYRYNVFNNNDWQYIPRAVIPTLNNGTAISIVNAGYGPPNYNVHTVGVSFRVKL
jgi:MtrB/PioB family decaheme-associated outer membrane protein